MPKRTKDVPAASAALARARRELLQLHQLATPPLNQKKVEEAAADAEQEVNRNAAWRDVDHAHFFEAVCEDLFYAMLTQAGDDRDAIEDMLFKAALAATRRRGWLRPDHEDQLASGIARALSRLIAESRFPS